MNFPNQLQGPQNFLQDMKKIDKYMHLQESKVKPCTSLCRLLNKSSLLPTAPSDLQSFFFLPRKAKLVLHIVTVTMFH